MRSFSPAFGPLKSRLERLRELDAPLPELVARRELGAPPREVDTGSRPADGGAPRCEEGARSPAGAPRRPSGRSKASVKSSGRSLSTHAFRSTFSSCRTLPGQG